MIKTTIAVAALAGLAGCATVDVATYRAEQPPLDLVITLDDATSAIYSAFLVDQEGTASTLRGLAEVILASMRSCATAMKSS